MATEQRPESRIARSDGFNSKEPDGLSTAYETQFSGSDLARWDGERSERHSARDNDRTRALGGTRGADQDWPQRARVDMSRELETVLRRLCHTQARRKKLEVLPDWVFLSRRVAAKVTAGV